MNHPVLLITTLSYRGLTPQTNKLTKACYPCCASNFPDKTPTPCFMSNDNIASYFNRIFVCIPVNNLLLSLLKIMFDVVCASFKFYYPNV